jgi:metal-dependent amidase/aminoacylase/carboxypeptidase family protein
MPIINRAADLHDEITAWRRDLHENLELDYDVYLSIGSELLTRIGVEELTTLNVEVLERQGWRGAAKLGAVRLGAAAC